MRYRRYVALGDSCAEGLDDPYPDGSGYRGFADLAAARLAERAPSLEYANLAVRGRRLDQILAEQVPLATSLRPDLVTLFGGGNDVLQGRWETRAVAEALDDAVRALAEAAATVVLFTLTDITGRLPGLRRLAPRVALLNRMIVGTAARHGAVLVDLRGDVAAGDGRYFGGDRLHLSELGHRRVAAHLLRALDIPPAENWLAPLPPVVREPYWRLAAREWTWLRHHVFPAVHGTVRNRLIGRQPGDGFVPKRPEPARVTTGG
ncbi:SGNH/GDSL hydrolase family protein [Actinophytocola sp. S1-96]|uniref:SGNH/GDSL hydrolase family protein n=1 Tax=Actinophytocola gossypii TaxID=2812003 RepID=A0ABT2J7E4_9PSEU|nr:SGNH/GDSL hydrolase family protein [Actinophytocola gossypii]MCT2583696.1 SGNH/GDSL hydrolase family protein [Actinophytocola gossypii]